MDSGRSYTYVVVLLAHADQLPQWRVLVTSS